MAMTPQDQHAMVAKARRLLSELDEGERAAVATLAPGVPPHITAEQADRLMKLGLIERRLDGLELTDLGEMVRAALEAGAKSRT